MPDNIFADTPVDIGGQSGETVDDTQTAPETEGGQSDQQSDPSPNDGQAGADTSTSDPQGTDGQGSNNGENSKEDWASKFESPEQMFETLQKTQENLDKALSQYNNLRPEFTKKTQELSKLKNGDGTQQKQTQQAQQGQNQQPQGDVPQESQKVLKAVADLVGQKLEPYREAQERMQMAETISRIKEADPVFEKYEGKTLETLKNNPQLWDLGIEKALLTSYKITKADNMSDYISDVVNTQKSEQEKNNKASSNPRNTKGSDAPSSQEPSREEKVASNIVSASRNDSLFI